MTLRELDLRSKYTSSNSDMMGEFLVPVLERSASYSRGVGYFSSSIFALAPAIFGDFFSKGGKMRLLCSQVFTPADFNELTNPQGEQESAQQLFERLENDLDATNTSRLMRALIAAGLLEMRIVKTPNQTGIFHDKIGVARDSEGFGISFVGSANESSAAWSGRVNHERLDVFCSWISEDAKRFEDHFAEFETNWGGLNPQLQLAEVITKGHAVANIELASEDIQKQLELSRKELMDARGEKVPAAVFALRGYQESAKQNWEAQERGIISFVTGGGKTITALSIVQDWIKKGSPAIIAVPSRVLVQQWESEARKFLPGAELLTATGDNSSIWRKLVGPLLAKQRDQDGAVIITTYSTLASDKMRMRLQNKADLLIVGDEVHRFGAPSIRGIANWLSPAASLGLSATTIRQYDEVGTDKIFDYFGPTLEPVYGLAEAINDNNLCPYRYQLVPCQMSDEETEEWDRLSREISKISARLSSAGSGTVKENLERELFDLLLGRSRILKKAERKVPLAAEILQENCKTGDRFLVYCEDVPQLEELKNELRSRSFGVVIHEYHSMNEKHNQRHLSHFAEEGGIMLAIRCLDEGVDIPSVNKALIISSSTSDREFIQRRGRVLRNHPKKSHSQIFDFYGVRADSMEPISKSELSRLSEFAENSENPNVKYEVRDLVRKAGADLGIVTRSEQGVRDE